MSDHRVLFAGFAGKVGGAGTEAFETARFFIAHGLEVHMVPTWESPETVRREEVEALGVRVHCIKPAAVGDLLRELGCPPVVSFCNPKFLTHYRRFKEHSPVVWVNCMTSVSGEERAAWKKHGLPGAFVFQSQFQRQILENRLKRHQYRPELGHLIRGAFCWDAWEFDPLARVEGEPFVVGRAARPDPAKWSSHTLEALDPVPNVQAICLGADERVRRQLGNRRYAQLLAPGAIPAREFYHNLHAMIAYNSTAKENWPRVGLEAMATGVPLVADGHWGWTEMIRHGETGFLARRTSEFTEYLRLLEADEALRNQIAQQARQSLEHELANPDAIWGGWCGIWRDIGAGHLCDVTGRSPIQKIESDLKLRDMMDSVTERLLRENSLPNGMAIGQLGYETLEQEGLAHQMKDLVEGSTNVVPVPQGPFPIQPLNPAAMAKAAEGSGITVTTMPISQLQTTRLANQYNAPTDARKPTEDVQE